MQLSRHLELLLFLLFTTLSGLFAYFLDYQPRARLNLEYIFLGLCCALILVVARILITGGRPGVLDFDKLGSAVARASGEEIFLRAFVFGYLTAYSSLLAYALNFALSFLLTFSRERDYRKATSSAVEGTILALFFEAHRVVSLIFVARLSAEMALFTLQNYHFSAEEMYRKLRRK